MILYKVFLKPTNFRANALYPNDSDCVFWVGYNNHQAQDIKDALNKVYTLNGVFVFSYYNT